MTDEHITQHTSCEITCKNIASDERVFHAARTKKKMARSKSIATKDAKLRQIIY